MQQGLTPAERDALGDHLHSAAKKYAEDIAELKDLLAVPGCDREKCQKLLLVAERQRDSALRLAIRIDHSDGITLELPAVFACHSGLGQSMDVG